MPDPLLDVGDHLAGVAFKPMPVEVFGDPPELNNEVSGQVLGLGFAAFLPPKPMQGRFVRTHDDPSVGAADKDASFGLRSCEHFRRMTSSICEIGVCSILAAYVALIAYDMKHSMRN